MNKFITAAVTAALLTSAAPLAFADDATSVGAGAGADVSAGVNANGSDLGVNAGAGASGAGTVETGNGVLKPGVATDLTANASTDIDAAIDSAKSAEDVNIVLWTQVASDNSADLKVFEDSMAGDNANIDSVHTKVEANATLMAALEAEGYDSDDVVSVQTAADGKVKLFVDDRA